MFYIISEYLFPALAGMWHTIECNYPHASETVRTTWAKVTTLPRAIEITEVRSNN